VPRRNLLPWLALAALALLPRIAGALLHPPWHDEYFTVWVSGLSWSGLVAALRLDSGPPLLYVLARLLALTGLPLLAAARAVAVAAGVAATLLGARAARATAGSQAGWWTGALLALNPLAVAWSSEGRAYPLVLLAGALAWDRLAAIRATGRGAVGLAGAVALGCWSHGLGVVVAAAVAAVALGFPPARRRHALLGLGAGLLAFLPWAPIEAAQPPQATAWMAATWQSMPPAERAAAPVRLLPPAAPFGNTLDLPSPPLIFQLLAAAACVGLLVASRPAPLPLLLFAVPAAGLAAAAWLGVPVLYPGRSEAVYLLPFLGLVAAAAAAGRARRAMAAFLVAVSAGVTATALVAWQREPPSREERVAAAIRASCPEGATVVANGYWWLELWYQLRRTSPRYPLVGFPDSVERHPGWQDPRARPPQPAATLELLSRLGGSGGRLAAVITPGTPSGETLLGVARQLGLAPRLGVPGGVLLLPEAAP
jgi:hypothetical protein